MIENRVFYMEYENLENICFSCCFYGHKLDSCPSQAPQQSAETEEPTSTPTADPEGNAGSWMTVHCGNKGKPKNTNASPKQPSSGSSFTTLKRDEDISNPPTAETNSPDKGSTTYPVIKDHATKLIVILSKHVSQNKSVTQPPKDG
ncbi:hypothetical protein LINPERPRIM_LOCUS25751 [Linum perenne]